MNRLISGSAISLAVVLCIHLPANADQRFYQHLQVADPGAAVEELLDSGWSIRGYEPLPITGAIDWSTDPYRDSNWRFQLNAMYPAAPVFQLLEVEFEGDLLDIARNLFDDWIDFNIESDQDHPFRWNDMATGIRATYLAQLIYYESLHGGEPRLSRYLAAGRRHLEELADPENFAESNHGLFQVVGIASLCSIMSLFEDCSREAEYAEHRYRSLFQSQFNVEGMHLEHSPEYHLLALRTFIKIEKTSLLRLQPKDRTTLDLAVKNLAWLIHPDGGFAEVGDTEASSAIGASRFDASAKWLVSGGVSGIPPEHGLRVYPDTGYIFFRSDPLSDRETYLFFTVAHHSRNHKHMDTGAFEWSDRGQRVLVDSGKWGYEDTRERRYVISLEGHNVLETKGVRSSPGDLPPVRPQLIGFRSSALFGMGAAMRLNRRFVDASWLRILVGLPDNWLLVVDEIDEAVQSTHTAWFHLAPEFSLQPAPRGGFEARVGEASERLAVLPLMDVKERLAFRGESEPVMRGWYSPAYGALQPNWQIGFRAEGGKVRMATLFRWLEDGVELQPADNPDSDPASGGRSYCWYEGEVLQGVRLEFHGSDVRARPCE